MYRKAYFHLRDETAKASGYTRVELHNMAKEIILPKMIDEEDCWDNTDYSSTKNLTEKGWELFLEEFKNWINQIC